jgi:N-acetylglutamate synthase-like GNAT family acetyltransferase
MTEIPIDPGEEILPDIQCRWLINGDEDPAKLADFFVKNVDEKYISHGEVTDGRANSLTEWKKDLKEVMQIEFQGILSGSFKKNAKSLICICTKGRKTVGIALVELKPETKVAVLEDIIINRHSRKKSVGSRFLKWIENDLILKGISFIFLESGIRNSNAHNFFQKNGYQQSSIVLVKKL